MRTSASLSQETLKLQARELVKQLKGTDQPIILGLALERVSKANGFRDWNTARALLPPSVRSSALSPQGIFFAAVSKSPRVRHHSVTLPGGVSDEVAARRREFIERAHDHGE